MPSCEEASDHLATSRTSSRSLNIALLGYRSNPYSGGQGLYLKHLAKALTDAGHSVDVISGEPYPELDPGINLIKLPGLNLFAAAKPFRALQRRHLLSVTDLFEWLSFNSGGFPEPYTFGVRMAAYMRDKIDQYDIMHDNQTLCYGMLEVRDMGLPVVGTIHHPITMDKRIDIAHAKWPWIKFLKWRWYSFLNMQIDVARQLDPLIVVSDSTLRDVERDFKVPKQRMTRIHHGIDHELFQPQPHITRRSNRLMVTASADVPLKGLIYLIRAYHTLLKTHPDLELLVVGRLREGQTMQELDKLGIRNRVKFVSGLSGEELRDLYAEATIAVSPSVYEGFGFPAGEALSCGVPLVATNGGSLPEVVGDAGVVVPHSNPPALAEAIDALLNDPERRQQMSVTARQHILDKFKWSRCANEVVDMYRDTIARFHQTAKL